MIGLQTRRDWNEASCQLCSEQDPNTDMSQYKGTEPLKWVRKVTIAFFGTGGVIRSLAAACQAFRVFNIRCDPQATATSEAHEQSSDN